MGCHVKLSCTAASSLPLLSLFSLPLCTGWLPALGLMWVISSINACRHASLCDHIVMLHIRGDPNAEGQDMFCPSNRDYPPFMRINPILSWSYSDVWAFLRLSGVAYCSLYDHGFTSVGSADNTFPNRWECQLSATSSCMTACSRHRMCSWHKK